MTHQISVTGNRRGINPPSLRALLRNAVKTALSAEGMNDPCEINILLTDDEGIHEVNLEMRDIDRPTDVLSFPLMDDSGFSVNPESERYMLGDIVVSTEKALEQAKEFGHSFEREIAFLTVHSMLHLLGYDHVDGGIEAVRMREKEETVLTQLGLKRNGSYYLDEE